MAPQATAPRAVNAAISPPSRRVSYSWPKRPESPSRPAAYRAVPLSSRTDARPLPGGTSGTTTTAVPGHVPVSLAGAVVTSDPTEVTHPPLVTAPRLLAESATLWNASGDRRGRVVAIAAPPAIRELGLTVEIRRSSPLELLISRRDATRHGVVISGGSAAHGGAQGCC